MRRKRLARLLKKLRAMRRSLPSLVQLLMRSMKRNGWICPGKRFESQWRWNCLLDLAFRSPHQIENLPGWLSHLPQNLFARNSPIHHPHPFCFSISLLDLVQKIAERAAITGIALQHFVGQRKPSGVITSAITTCKQSVRLSRLCPYPALEFFSILVGNPAFGGGCCAETCQAQSARSPAPREDTWSSLYRFFRYP
jgi:hypothetical protein